MKQTKITYNLTGMDEFKAQMKGYRARVGILGEKSARTDEESGLNNAEIGVIQLFGSFTNNIPARDFLIMPIDYNKRKIQKDLGAESVKAAIARKDFKKVFALLGVIAEGYIQKAFETAGYGQWAPNSPVTIARKGSSAPLINTAQLRRAISSEVVKKGAA